METTGARIRAARKQKSLTLRQMEQLTGINNSYLSQIEQDKRNITLRKASCLADALSVSLDWLAGRRTTTRREEQEILLDDVWRRHDE